MIKKNQLIKETAFYIDCAQKNLNYFDNVTICHCRQEYKKLGELTERNNKEIVESVTDSINDDAKDFEDCGFEKKSKYLRKETISPQIKKESFISKTFSQNCLYIFC